MVSVKLSATFGGEERFSICSKWNFSHHLRNQYFQVPIIGDFLGGNPFILKDMMPVKDSFSIQIILGIYFLVQYRTLKFPTVDPLIPVLTIHL